MLPGCAEELAGNEPSNGQAEEPVAAAISVLRTTEEASTVVEIWMQ
ncbi:Protein of unknown function [Gryllus bimaculatus]|nr:Protein of unknown function [Gryllus bimaculatus]